MRPIHFEILTEGPETLIPFYREVFGWEIATWGGGEQAYWLATTGPEGMPGINGAIMHRHLDQAVILTVEVGSLDEALEHVAASGGRTVHGPNVIPEVGRHAYCADPAGNLIGLMEPITDRG